jgi:carboxylesterase type B
MLTFKLTLLFLINLILTLHVSAQSGKCKVSDPVLHTKSGKINGVCKNVNLRSNSTDTGNIYSWLSVPYAKPPVGDSRFKPPQLVDSWSTTLDTKQMPSFCMNFANKSNVTSFEYLNSFIKNSFIKLDEDCLYLNIFMSESAYENITTNTAAPILVYFQHGNQNFFNPISLVFSNNIILITVNYRLDVFGFLHLKEDSEDEYVEGNQGFSDQVLALKWINENAENFGGDANKITLFGSYGGAKVAGYHLLYKPSWPLYRNVILNSGTPINLAQNTISSHLASSRAKSFLKDMLKCKDGSLMRCARRLDAFNLTMASRGFLFGKMGQGSKLTASFLQSAFGKLIKSIGGRCLVCFFLYYKQNFFVLSNISLEFTMQKSIALSQFLASELS